MSLFHPSGIVVHHSLTKDSETVSWSALRRYHVSTLGWKDIGYHGGVELVREAYEAFYGRPTTMQGAHTRGQNSASLGICFVGNYDEEAPEDRMLLVGINRIILPWMEQYGISARQIFGHNHFSSKTCPGRLFDMSKFRQLVHQESQKRLV